ncbi:hypothetical protein N7485_011127 [Penicillium canescens]|nr:hypothetical protein N7485_011127 [Penicillium canescens]
MPVSERSPGVPAPEKGEIYKKGLLTIDSSLCKIRKVKCSGTQPCSRCDELRSECTYNEPFQSDHDGFDPQPAHQDLESTVLRMNRICEQMQQSMGRFGLVHPRGAYLQRRHWSDELPRPSKPLAHTDFQYTLNLTQDAMRARDLTPPQDSASGHHSVADDELKYPDTLITLLQAARPILELGHEKVTQLFTIFKDEVYPIYPCISLELGYGAIDVIFSHLTHAATGATSKLDMIDVELTKSVLAIALLVRGETQNVLAVDLEAQLAWSVDSCLDQEKPQVEDVVMATLLSVYLDLKQRPVKAWRMSGVAARLCLELGLHREKFFEDVKALPQRIIDWKRLFACVYRIDRKCSFYSGLPWTLHDRDLDASVLRIEPQGSYLSTMISLDSNLSEIWTLVNAPSSQTKNNAERIEFLTFQLQKLVDKIPTEDFVSPEPTVIPPAWLQTGLKHFCHLRVHHIRILTQIGAFGSLRDLISLPASAKSLLTAAAKSVDLHSRMADAGEISPFLLPTAVKLLLTSLSIMLFSVSHRPEEYGPMCSKPFQTAIIILHNLQNCVKDLDSKIFSTLEVLEKIAGINEASHSKTLAPVFNRKESTRNNVYQGESFGEGTLFDELPTPDSELFSLLGDVGMAATDMLHFDDIFG